MTKIGHKRRDISLFEKKIIKSTAKQRGWVLTLCQEPEDLHLFMLFMGKPFRSSNP